ncbi:MAG: FKBP-type peptidyl-prolyl cis-trans isomerase [Isosphaeraceae bacterium]
MRLFLTAAALAGLMASTGFAQNPSAPNPAAAPSGLKDLKQKASYGYGYALGRQLKAQGIELDPRIIAQGLADALGGGQAALSDAEIQESLQIFARQIQEKHASMAGKLAVTNKVEGERFLAENKTKPGVTTTPTGLQYKVIKQGTGPKPKLTDKVTVHYEGKLIDGTVFDSSIKRGQPISFDVTGVIPGWTEALQLMPVGSTWQLFIPSNLAYGEQPRPGGPIGPNAVLTFVVQLIKIGE